MPLSCIDTYMDTKQHSLNALCLQPQVGISILHASRAIGLSNYAIFGKRSLQQMRSCLLASSSGTRLLAKFCRSYAATTIPTSNRPAAGLADVAIPCRIIGFTDKIQAAQRRDLPVSRISCGALDGEAAADGSANERHRHHIHWPRSAESIL